MGKTGEDSGLGGWELLKIDSEYSREALGSKCQNRVFKIIRLLFLGRRGEEERESTVLLVGEWSNYFSTAT